MARHAGPFVFVDLSKWTDPLRVSPNGGLTPFARRRREEFVEQLHRWKPALVASMNSLRLPSPTDRGNVPAPADSSPPGIVRWALQRFGLWRIAVTTSFGLEGCALIVSYRAVEVAGWLREEVGP